MNLKNKAVSLFVPRIIWLVSWIVYLLSRNHFEINKEAQSDNIILAFWHGEILMLPFLYRKFRKKPQIYIITSNHFDGGLVANMCRLFGMNIIRGSTDSSGTNRGGVRALRQSIKALRDNFDIGIAIDGPRGPYHQIADGIIMMAQKTGKKIGICRVFPSSYYELKTWDKFRIPLPFGKICYHISEGFSLDSHLSIQEAKEEILRHIALTDKDV